MQRAYAVCAEGYGFKIDPCPPHDPQKTEVHKELASWGGGKGIVESGVKYLKGNFLPLRLFRDLADLNAQARFWAMQEAGVRCHGATRRSPLELFALEAPLLQALPSQAPLIALSPRSKSFSRSLRSAWLPRGAERADI